MESYTKMSYKEKNVRTNNSKNKMLSKKDIKNKTRNIYNVKACFMIMLITIFISYMSIKVLELYGISTINAIEVSSVENFRSEIKNKFLKIKNEHIEHANDAKDTKDVKLENKTFETEEDTNKVSQMSQKDVILNKAFTLFKSGSFEMLGISKNSSLLKIEEKIKNNKENLNEPIIYKSDIKKAIYGNKEINEKLDNIENMSNAVINAFKDAKDMPSKNTLINAFFKFESAISKAKEEVDYYSILTNSNEMVDLENMKILIFHTHSQETYKDQNISEEGGVIYAGELLGKVLKDKYGFEVIHYTGKHDLVDGKINRDGSYERIEENIKAIIESNKDIMLAIDLHRDGVDESIKLVSEIDGKKCAQIMLVNGLSMQQKNGVLEEIISLKNEYLHNNLNLSMNMHLVSDYLFPKLSRKILIKPYRYSLHMLPNTALVELGAQNNTLEEVENTIPYLADIIAKTLYLKSK